MHYVVMVRLKATVFFHFYSLVVFLMNNFLCLDFITAIPEGRFGPS